MQFIHIAGETLFEEICFFFSIKSNEHFLGKPRKVEFKIKNYRNLTNKNIILKSFEKKYIQNLVNN